MKTKNNKIDPVFEEVIRDLRLRRRAYIKAEIAMESGCLGRMRRWGVWGFKREKHPEFIRKREAYWRALEAYRRKIIADFSQDQRNLLKSRLFSIYRITVEDEIERVKIIKERIIRKKGLRGFIRTKVQDYREIMPSFKLILGVLIFAGNLPWFFLGIEDLLYLRLALATVGIMLCLEGLQQKESALLAIKKGLTRDQLYRKARRRMKEVIRNFDRIKQEDRLESLGDSITRIYVGLEEGIWQSRQLDKRAECRRYVFAILGGSLLGATLVLPSGLEYSLMIFVIAGLSHLFIYLLIPFGLLRMLLLEREDRYYYAEKFPSERLAKSH